MKRTGPGFGHSVSALMHVFTSGFVHSFASARDAPRVKQRKPSAKAAERKARIRVRGTIPELTPRLHWEKNAGPDASSLRSESLAPRERLTAPPRNPASTADPASRGA